MIRDTHRALIILPRTNMYSLFVCPSGNSTTTSWNGPRDPHIHRNRIVPRWICSSLTRTSYPMNLFCFTTILQCIRSTSRYYDRAPIHVLILILPPLSPYSTYAIASVPSPVPRIFISIEIRQDSSPIHAYLFSSNNPLQHETMRADAYAVSLVAYDA